jgi:hypothetical protein
VPLEVNKYMSDIAIGDEELSIWMADIYSLAGEKELSVKWIRNAAKKGFINYEFFQKHDPYLKSLRKEVHSERLWRI